MLKSSHTDLKVLKFNEQFIQCLAKVFKNMSKESLLPLYKRYIILKLVNDLVDFHGQNISK